MTTATRIAEVIEASTTRLVAQCYQLYDAPPLGALVRAGAPEDGIFAVVTAITTDSLDPGRRPIARGQEAQTEEQVYRDHPELAHLLRTHLEVTVVGYARGVQLHREPAAHPEPLPAHPEPVEGLFRNLPARPPRIHTFLYACPPDELRAFTASLDFLPLLLADASPAADEAAALLLRTAAATHDDPGAFLLGAGRELANLLGADPPRLNALLRRLASQ